MMDFGCLANMVSVLVKTFLFGKLYQCFTLLTSFLFLASILLFMLPVHFWRTNMASRLPKLISFVILFRLVFLTFVILFRFGVHIVVSLLIRDGRWGIVGPCRIKHQDPCLLPRRHLLILIGSIYYR